ncbi:MAG: DnaJ domain-containing protein [Bacteroidales bacterium]|jgi:hypothetical protein|nr:DnaJ domain-containing protein [Bacteroidales bacterium]
MDQHDYYIILGITPSASLDEIKKAYRTKARLYHPDVNHEPGAEDKFIRITEAYEFLLTHHGKISSDEEAFMEAMENWRKYRQTNTQRRAAAYARAPYAHFRKTKLYKTTKIFDGATIIFSFAISVLVLVYTVTGYIYRLRHPIEGIDKPSVAGFLLLLLMGILFFAVSTIYLLAWRETLDKSRKDHGHLA